MAIIDILIDFDFWSDKRIYYINLIFSPNPVKQFKFVFIYLDFNLFVLTSLLVLVIINYTYIWKLITKKVK